MRSHRTTIFIAALFATLAVASPAAARASSLLSGYGGPGQGSQAILGSALVNGPRGGGGSGSGGGSGASNGSSGETSGSLAVEAPSRARGEGATSGGESNSGGGESARGGGGGSQGARGSASAGGEHAGTRTGTSGAGGSQATASASLYPASERIPPGASDGTLGLSGLDLAFVLIGCAALAFIGVLTGRLARTDTAIRNR